MSLLLNLLIGSLSVIAFTWLDIWLPMLKHASERRAKLAAAKAPVPPTKAPVRQPASDQQVCDAIADLYKK